MPEMGAQGSFFKLFNGSAAVPLTNKQLVLFDVRALCTFFFFEYLSFFYTTTEMLYLMECGEIGGGLQRLGMRGECICFSHRQSITIRPWTLT